MINPFGRKNVVPSTRSNSSMIMAPERTGSARRSSTAVTKRAQTVSGRRKNVSPGARRFNTVVMKLTAVRSDEIPSTRRASSHRVCPFGCTAESGAYDVQPDWAAPPVTKKDQRMRTAPGTAVQNENMLSVGNAMSRAPICSGTTKLPNAPIRIGMIAKKIMIVACIVKSEL